MLAGQCALRHERRAIATLMEDTVYAGRFSVPSFLTASFMICSAMRASLHADIYFETPQRALAKDNPMGFNGAWRKRANRSCQR
jgi:hypothetical protein